MQHYLTNQSVEVQSLNYAFAVVCESVGNPQYMQDENQSVSPKMIFACDTLNEASTICRNYIEEHNLGGGNWVGGQVYHPKNGIIANVSFNGRVWTLNERSFSEEDLTKSWKQFSFNDILSV